MQDRILNFSNEEMQVLVDRNFFELKHSATAKMVELFGELESELKMIFAKSGIVVDGLNAASGKIFRGENYRLFPYVLLDCPRMFNKESVFAMRTMFWWGNEFTFTLHLQGRAWEQYRNVIISNFEMLRDSDFLFCVNDSPWQYHLGADNYIALSTADFTVAEQKLRTAGFIKLTRKLSITDYSRVVTFGKETLEIFLKLLRD